MNYWQKGICLFLTVRKTSESKTFMSIQPFPCLKPLKLSDFDPVSATHLSLKLFDSQNTHLLFSQVFLRIVSDFVRLMELKSLNMTVSLSEQVWVKHPEWNGLSNSLVTVKRPFWSFNTHGVLWTAEIYTVASNDLFPFFLHSLQSYLGLYVSPLYWL